MKNESCASWVELCKLGRVVQVGLSCASWVELCELGRVVPFGQSWENLVELCEWGQVVESAGRHLDPPPYKISKDLVKQKTSWSKSQIIQIKDISTIHNDKELYHIYILSVPIYIRELKILEFTYKTDILQRNSQSYILVSTI